MRKIFLFALIAFLPVVASAQNHDSGRKFPLCSDCTVGMAGQYSNQVGQSNIGLNALFTERVGDNWRFRASATISGLLEEYGFDRYGTALVGACFDFVPLAYVFADVGGVANPSMPQKVGLAADAGLGFNMNFGKRSILFAEGGIDRVQNGKVWISTVSCRLGYAIRLGGRESRNDQNCSLTY